MSQLDFSYTPEPLTTWIGMQVGLFLNQGQCCCASSRLFVQDTIYDKFVERAAADAAKRVLGDPAHADTDQGPQVVFVMKPVNMNERAAYGDWNELL